MSQDRDVAATGPTVIRTLLLTAAMVGGTHVERVEIHRIELAPRQRTGLHLHRCPVVGVVMRGSIFFALDGEPGRVLEAGDAFYEPADTHVLHFDARDEGATFVAYYLLGPGEHELITMLA